MKKAYFLFLVLSLSFLSFSSQACDSPARDRDLFALFYVDNQPTTWRSVLSRTYVKDRGTKILVYARSSVSSSTVEFKNQTYRIGQVSFCNKGNSKITVTHPEHGELQVTRRGRGSESYIELKRGAFLTFRLRPIQHTLDRRPN